MNDNDLIRRGDVRKSAEWFETEDGEVLAVDMDDVDDIPAVPHEMTAGEFVKEEQRMCGTYYLNGCYHCPLFDIFKIRCLAGLNKTTVAIVEAWRKEHPERSEE